MRCSLLLLALTSATAHYEVSFDPLNPYVKDGDRSLQQSQATCFTSGSRFLCNIATTISATATDINGTQTDSNITLAASIDCDFVGQQQVNYRESTGCTCESQVITPDGNSRACACLLCPAGFGNNPVAIDCDYGSRPETVSPFILGPCSSYDCSFACNGTCSFGCEEPVQPQCQELCFGSAAPTPAPTGASGVENVGMSSLFELVVGATSLLLFSFY